MAAITSTAADANSATVSVAICVALTATLTTALTALTTGLTAAAHSAPDARRDPGHGDRTTVVAACIVYRDVESGTSMSRCVGGDACSTMRSLCE